MLLRFLLFVAYNILPITCCLLAMQISYPEATHSKHEVNQTLASKKITEEAVH